MCWLGIRVDMAGMIRNVNVRSYLPSMDVIVAVMNRIDVVVNVSRTLIVIEHFFCLIPRELAGFSVMKFIHSTESVAVCRLACVPEL